MTNDTQDYDAFARILQTAYQEVRRSTPRSRPEVEERLRTKLEAYGVTLTTDILRGLRRETRRGTEHISLNFSDVTKALVNSPTLSSLNAYG